MEINENILSQIYMSQNYDAQPLKSETSKANEQKNVTGRKPEGDKPLENRTIFQIGGTQYDLSSREFRIGLYNFVKGKTSLQGELSMIRQRLGLTDKGESQVQENKALDTRSVINEIFARPENVQAKINDALAGVVKFPNDVQKAICAAIWRQRDNPGIRKFLQSGGSSQDLAAICKLTLDSMEAHGRKSFADRMVMSYLKGFTLGTGTSPITFSTEFEKSFEEDQVIREEHKGVKERKTVELKSLETSSNKALTELENKTKDLFPKSNKEDSIAGEKYLRKKYDDVKKELQRFCATRKVLLDKADAECLEKLVSNGFDKELTEKVDGYVTKMKDFQQWAKRFDELAKCQFDFSKVFGEEPQNSQEEAYYHKACKNFKADYELATGSAEGKMWELLNELPKEELTDEGLKKIWNNHYCPHQNASVQIENPELNKGKENSVGTAGGKDVVENEEKAREGIDLSGWQEVDIKDMDVKKESVDKQEIVRPEKENKLGAFLANGAFKDKFIRDIRQGETQESYNDEVNKTFRENIFPNWPSLKRRLEDLRRETMLALGIKPELESWFMKENPRFDMDSPSFLDDIRPLKGNFKGQNVTSVEDMILSRCRIKDTVSYAPKDGGLTTSYTIIVGKRPENDKDDKNIYVNDVESYNMKICELNAKVPKGHEMGAFVSQVQGLVEKREQIEELDKLFGDFVRKFGKDIGKEVDEAVKSLGNAFTGKELEEISALIRKAVTDPIIDDKVKNIWDIQPVAFMSNFVQLCVNKEVPKGEGFAGVVREMVKRQVEANFKLTEGGKGCLIAGGDRIMQDENDSPRKVIESAINANKGLAQTGGNNCFMVSIVNALLGNEKGREVLKQCFREDGKYQFKNRKGERVELTDAEVGQWVEKDDKLAQMSKLEQTVWAAWLKVRFTTPDEYKRVELGKDAPGNQCGASEFAFLFGLTTANSQQGNAIDGVALPGGRLSRWVETQKHLASGQIAIAHHGGAENGHYVSITGAVSQGPNGAKGFSCFDSTFNDTWLGLDRIQVDSGEDDPSLSQILLLTFPDVA